MWRDSAELEGSQDSHICPSAKSNVLLMMSMEHWWNDTGGKAEVLEEEPVSVPLRQRYMPCRLTRDRTRVFALKTKKWKCLYFLWSPISERALLCWKVPRYRPFVLVLRVRCTWVWIISGKVLTGKTRRTGRQNCPIATLFTNSLTRADVGPNQSGRCWRLHLIWIIFKHSIRTAQ
jgi:hypothetical protein